MANVDTLRQMAGTLKRMNPLLGPAESGWSDEPEKASPINSGLLAGVLAKLNDVAFGIESITHRDAIERPFLIGRFQGTAICIGDPPKIRDAGHKEHGLERCRCASSRWNGDFIRCRTIAWDPMHDQLESP